MNLLEDMNVISVSRGSGIYIESKENSLKFIKRFENKETIGTLKTQIRRLIQKKQDIENEISEVLGNIIDYSDRLRNINKIIPMEFNIPPGSHIIGQTISETKFWQNTGGTVVGIRREDYLILSPGPYAEFQAGDTILVIGDTGVLDRIKKYLEE